MALELSFGFATDKKNLKRLSKGQKKKWPTEELSDYVS